MSLPSINNSNISTLGFSNIPNDTLTATLPFLDNLTVLTIISVCKFWQKHLQVQKSLKAVIEDATCLRLGFPKKIVELMRKNKLSLFNMPILSDENARNLIENQDLKCMVVNEKKISIARFNLDQYPGIAFILKANLNKIQKINFALSKDFGDKGIESSKMIICYWSSKPATKFQSVFYGDFIKAENAIISVQYKNGYNRLMNNVGPCKLIQENYDEISTCLAKTNPEYDLETIEVVSNPLPLTKWTSLEPSKSLFAYAWSLIK